MSYLEHIKKKIENKRICVYPMGIVGKSLVHKLKSYNMHVDFFSDKNPELWGTQYQGVECISPNQLVKLNQDELIVIIESLYYKEIKNDLEQKGIKNILRIYPSKFAVDEYLEANENVKERVQNVIDICADERSKEVYKCLTDVWWLDECEDNYFEPIYSKNQYFDDSVISLTEDEVFVDGGAYIGDSAEGFLDFCKSKYKKMHLFELDNVIYDRLKDNMSKKSDEKIICYPYGLGKENVTVCYFSGDSDSTITQNENEGNKIGVIRKMDDVLKNEKVTFIKMDIEGAETDALRGCEQIIRTQTPKLAICIYHSPEDMLHIPLLIKQMVPEYKIYIRHYTDMMYETVCYAIKE